MRKLRHFKAHKGNITVFRSSATRVCTAVTIVAPG